MLPPGVPAVPPPEDDGNPALAVVLHDVAPARWAGCLRVLAEIDRVAARSGSRVPTTLLVVPRLHGQDAGAPFLHWLRRLGRSGHELALHGYLHRDDAPAHGGTGPAAWVDHARRRWYTAGEGEFCALSREEAAERIALGRAWAAGHGLPPMPGFVAPAWLLSAGSRAAVRDAGFAWTCTLNTLTLLPSQRVLRARSLVFSTRAAWRRRTSIAWNTVLAAAQRDAPLLRLELHPHDADHAAVRACWSRILADSLRTRRAVTMSQAADPAAAGADYASAAYSFSRL